LVPRLREQGIEVRGVRLDSGDLADHARKVRRILDDAGLQTIQIFASGGLDEGILRDHVAAGVPIDGYGIGTSLTTSGDAPALDCAYKIQEYDGQPKRKRSEGKATWPGRKQVYRRYGADGTMAEDVLTLEDDVQDGDALIAPVMRGGERIGSLPTLTEVRERSAKQLARLPEGLRRLDPASYPVRVAAALKALAATVDRST